MRQGVATRLVTAHGSDYDESSSEPVAGVSYKAPDGEVHTAYAHLTIACDGMYSMLRKRLHERADAVRCAAFLLALNNYTPLARKTMLFSFVVHGVACCLHEIQMRSWAGLCRKTSTFVGLILRDVQLPYPNHGHVVLGSPSPILVYPIASREVRVLVDVPPSEKMPSSATGELREYLRARVLPQLPETLRPAFETALESAKLRAMQNKQLAANPLHPPGALLLGDSFNMRHPLTGGGMTVALSDTKLLCDMLQPLPDFTDSLQTAKCTSDFYIIRKPLSSTINTLAEALYEVFREKEAEAHKEMRQAVFDYLALGTRRRAAPHSVCEAAATCACNGSRCYCAFALPRPCALMITCSRVRAMQARSMRRDRCRCSPASTPTRARS
jgi:2-polyprenyl-6-methoxyphenol hydroxylase-like FAD-dependent oxidoreductase